MSAFKRLNESIRTQSIIPGNQIHLNNTKWLMNLRFYVQCVHNNENYPEWPYSDLEKEAIDSCLITTKLDIDPTKPANSWVHHITLRGLWFIHITSPAVMKARYGFFWPEYTYNQHDT